MTSFSFRFQDELRGFAKRLAPAFALGFAGAFIAAPLSANEYEAACLDFVSEYGGDEAGCACLGEAAEQDADVALALAEIYSPEDMEDLEDGVRSKIEACFPVDDAL